MHIGLCRDVVLMNNNLSGFICLAAWTKETKMPLGPCFVALL